MWRAMWWIPQQRTGGGRWESAIYKMTIAESKRPNRLLYNILMKHRGHGAW